MRIEVVVHADTLCAWCFIQKHALEDAMERYKARHPEIEFDVRWKPFLLFPTLREGDKRALYEKTMSPEKHALFLDRIARTGLAHDIAFHVTGTTGPSQASHALIQHALTTRGPAVQAAVVEALYRGNFEAGRDITDAAWLVEVGHEAAGFSEEEVREVVRRGAEEGWRGVEDEVRRAMADGVRAVPCVTVAGRFRVGGFQEGRVFEDVFEKVRTER